MEKLIEIFKDNWLKKRSIAIALIIIGAFYVSLITSVHNWEGINISGIQYFYWAIPFIVILFGYMLLCFCFDHLPRASKGTIAVLFCVDAESEKMYEAARFKLVGDFRASLIGDNKEKFDAYCVRRDQVVKYNIDKKEGAQKLLDKTNCVLIIFVRYTADDVSNAENFELRIDYEVRAPEFDDVANALLSHDLATLKEPVGKQRFVKANTINVFNFTAQTLACACQYILGFMYLLAGDNQNALKLLMSARETIVKEHSQILGMEKMRELIDDRLYVTLCQIAADHLQCFQKNKQLDALQEMTRFLTIANAIRPDTFFYNLNMAYAHIALYQDAVAAKRCVDKCKQSREDKKWVYSDAFLSAYCGQAPGTILSKYKDAFKVPYRSLVEIVEYIEFVITQDPEIIPLHLAAGLVYEEMGDVKLMKQHLALYLSMSENLDKRTINVICSKMQEKTCNADCNHQCVTCG